MKKKVNMRICLCVSLIVCLIASVVLNFVFALRENVEKCELDENIIFFGDSITDHYDVNNYFPTHNVVNKGESGDKSENLIKRLKNDVYDSNPSKVFILIGVNDIIYNVDSYDIILNIQTIIDSIKLNRSNAKIYVESVYPVNEKKLSDGDRIKNVDNKKISELNKKIKELCVLEKVVYIDMYNRLTGEDKNLKGNYTFDGLHMTDLGYLKVTSILKEYIDE